MAKLEPGQLLLVLWNDIASTADGDPDDAGLVLTKSVGWFRRYVKSHGKRALVLSYAEYPDGDALPGNGYIVIPTTNIKDKYALRVGERL